MSLERALREALTDEKKQADRASISTASTESERLRQAIDASRDIRAALDRMDYTTAAQLADERRSRTYDR